MADATAVKPFRRARAFLAASMLVMGACGIIYEYTLSVLGNNLMGSSHEQIFVVIGIMMFAMGVGATLQRRILGNLIDKFLLLELVLGMIGGTSTLLVYTAFTQVAAYQVVLYGIAFVIGVLIGLEIPLLIRINTQYSSSLRTNLSEILSMDYVGALLGALLFAYVLLSRLSLPRITVSLGMVNTAVALFGVLYFQRLVHSPRILLAGCAVTLALLTVGFSAADDWMAHLEQRCYRDPIVYRETTPYQHLVLTKRDDRLNLYINGHLQFSSHDEIIYHEMLVHVPMALAHRRDRVLILGGGDGLALREVLRYGDVQSVTLVDIDPAVVRLASEHPEMIRLNRAAFHDARVSTLEATGTSPGEKITLTRKTKLNRLLLDQRSYPLADVRVLNVDADIFVRDIREKFDVVILDFPDPDTVELAKLYSVDFYRALGALLHPGALLSTQSTSPYHAKQAFLCIGKTLRVAGFHSLPYQQYVPSFGLWGWNLAWLPTSGLESPESRLKSLPSLPVETSYLTVDVLRAAFSFGKDWLTANHDLVANTKLRPVMVQYYQRSWKE